jgi:hypothetical protein
MESAASRLASFLFSICQLMTRLWSSVFGRKKMILDSDYLGVLTPQEIEVLRNSPPSGIVHPVVSLALAEPKHQVAVNTEMAARLVRAADETWLRNLRHRLLATDDYSHASSALGEIRAYGALIETWMSVKPGPSVSGSKASPEFEVNAEDGAVIVEVHSRQLDNAQVAAIIEHHANLKKAHAEAVEKARKNGQKGNVVTLRTHSVFPTGAPVPHKPGDSVLTNTISRIARIKENETQVDPAKPFVLWLDLQDLTVWGTPICDELFRPLYTESKEGFVGSGPFWFALYGRKGSPLIKSCGYDYRSMPMAHEGRFYQTMKSHGGATRVSAVVYALPRATILMENPKPVHPLPSRFRASMLKAPFFRLDLSLIEWEPGLVAESVELQYKTILATDQALTTFYA